MSWVAYDIESNGLLYAQTEDKPVMDRIHVICAIDDSGKETIWHNDPDLPRTGDLEEAREYLLGFELRVSHNGQSFDEPVLRKFLGFPDDGKVYDTRVAAAVLWPAKDLKVKDWAEQRKGRLAEVEPGSHRLSAWGRRLGLLKGKFGATTDWVTLDQEMIDYCLQDVRVLVRLYKFLLERKLPPLAVEIEHGFSRAIDEQMRHGVRFDVVKSDAVVHRLQSGIAEIDEKLQRLFPPVEEVYYTPVRKEKKVKTVVFNPNSRQQVAARLMELGWVPKETTPTGLPKLDEKVLTALPYDGAKELAERFMLQGMMGKLSSGNKSWLSKVTKGRLHGFVHHNGTTTARCTHSNPNLGQVPSVDKYPTWGRLCRELFVADPGTVMVGWDAKGLELRGLAHYLAQYDGGAYAKVVLEGDPHQRHADAMGVERGEGKRIFYAFLYGAGDVHLGELMTDYTVKDEAKLRQIGKSLRAKLLRGIPGLKRLVDRVKTEAKKTGYLYAIDGRRLRVRSPHSALNTLLQSFGAIVVKYVTGRIHQHMRPYEEWAQVLHVHDEAQSVCPADLVGTFSEAINEAFNEVGHELDLKCPMEADIKVGASWAETH